MSRRIRLGLSALLLIGLLLPGAAAFGQKDKDAPKPPVWTHAFDVKCRKYGEADFTDTTQVVGVEVFRDVNTGAVLYLSEVGAVSGVPGKL